MKISSLSFILAVLFLFYGFMLPDNSFAQTGNLQVTIGPEAVRDAGAQWRRVGELDWNESGYTETNLLAGDYQVEFMDIDGWDSPPTRNVTIRGDETARLNVTYVQQTGGLTVIINPLEARDAGAQWRITGTDQWYGSGDTILDIEAGEHVIEFARVPGWLRPANQIVTIIGDETIVLSVTYQQGGDLQVFLEPLEAREAGAGWRLAGIVPDLEKFPSGWYDEDLVTIFGLRPGIYTMEFNAIPGWIKPENITVRITAGSTTFQSARYVISTETGSLRVFIEPAPAAFLGARWRRVGTDVWLHSGDLEKGFPEGTYTVEFKPVPGWVPPGNKAVSIHRGAPPSNMTGYYQSPQPGVRIMNWLESVYPALLPLSNLHVQQTDGWYIRYYPDSDAYLGSKGGRLYYYAPQIEDVIHDLGLEDSWIPHARESGF
ncbi:hypothetical protein [Desulfonatronovibrio magnus]|uniref:hypothetical protein n=1 Tax=Desulfonatronovibrio magnus TaxID=698827 RepID=UPI0005EB9E39|nr:hypothetical protein [Desulfonatronovibrio magnus]